MASESNPHVQDVLRMKYFVVMTSKRQLYPMYGGEKKLGKFRTVSTSASLKLLQKIVTGPGNLLTPGKVYIFDTNLYNQKNFHKSYKPFNLFLS